MTAGAWTQIGGAYTVSRTETALTLYAQLVGSTTAVGFYLDNVTITGAPAAGRNAGGNVQLVGWGTGWVDAIWKRDADERDAFARGSDWRYARLLRRGRTATYKGPSLNLLGVSSVVAGATYEVTAYVMLANADASAPTVTMSMKTADCATSGAYSQPGDFGAADKHGVDEGVRGHSASAICQGRLRVWCCISSRAARRIRTTSAMWRSGSFGGAATAEPNKTTRGSRPHLPMGQQMGGRRVRGARR